MAYIEEHHEPPPRPKKQGPPTLVKFYLLAYNILSALGWFYILLITVTHLFNLDGAHNAASVSPSPFAQLLARIPLARPARTAVGKLEEYLPAAFTPVLRRAATTYARVGWQTTIVQSFAVLEVLHVLLGWVRSPLGTTLAQVASRLYLVWGITYLFDNTRTHPLYASMVLSWAITEVVRYSFYAFALLGREPRFLLLLRYTLFYVLYPTGAGSEAGLIYASLPSPGPAASLLSHLPVRFQALFEKPWYQALHDDVRGVLFCIWWPGLYVMYTHMMKQRRRVLGKGRTLGAKPKSI
ncbi:PTPLA-domain-containing protein [Obba rivulosa]|uniref:Very-long-chain (3R)-3-hydroxyacyl-CoA dehydratase n=1 Tax=Obba rivulosa TaxID=1052685 RepID=A0A8E2AQ03_9APHY|nr:PTPLA-domain-containing protein [Obba rivulosa]